VHFLEMFLKCLFIWKLPVATPSEMQTADVIVTQASHHLKDGTLGPGNQTLGNVVMELHRLYPDKPIIPQDDVARTAPDIKYFAIAKPPEDNQEGESTTQWNTYTVAVFQAQICWRNQWRTVVVVAEPVHHGRTVWVMEKLGLNPLLAPVPRTSESYYHPDSKSWFSRGRWSWQPIPRELLCRIYFLLTGKI